MVPPVCPDDGESDIAPSGPIDRSALPPGFALPADPAQQKAVAFALGAVGMPYVFGAKGPDAYDCSGLTQAAWAAAGVGVSAGTLTQIHDGVPVSRLADLAPGDLLFTPGSLGTPSNPRHVGIYARPRTSRRRPQLQGRRDPGTARRLAEQDRRDPPGRRPGSRRRPAARLPRPRRGGRCTVTPRQEWVAR